MEANPAPAGEGQGKTTVSWDTTEGSIGKVYVSANGGLELLFADGHRGSALAHWIETGSTYEFRLYDSDHTELLAKLLLRKQSSNQEPGRPVEQQTSNRTCAGNNSQLSVGTPRVIPMIQPSRVPV